MTKSQNPNFSSLAELAKDERTNSNKSQLTYYARIGLIAPEYTAGGVQIYDKEKTVQILQRIKTLSIQGYKLTEIKKMLEK